ncbi:MAG TPA: PIG-L family deacetylase, partial [Paludibacteraceae bacterium]|nr:PIG-L family deacetylase [Paludibacteraceae bacterium]
MENILAVVAHPDDLEIMAGGTVLKYKSLGAKIHVLVITNGSWISEKGETMRSINEAKLEFENVSKFMQYDSYEM